MQTFFTDAFFLNEFIKPKFSQQGFQANFKNKKVLNCFQEGHVKMDVCQIRDNKVDYQNLQYIFLQPKDLTKILLLNQNNPINIQRQVKNLKYNIYFKEQDSKIIFQFNDWQDELEKWELDLYLNQVQKYFPYFYGYQQYEY